jgi:hypothetical protein
MRSRLVAPFVVAGLLLSACGGEAVPEPAITGSTVTESPSTEPSPEPSESPEPTEPPEPVTPTHGGRYWAVYVAFGPFDSPEIDEGIQRLADLGIEAGVSSLGCDQGAERIFSADATDTGLVGAYFQTEQDGIDFLATLDDAAYGPVRVRTFCLD